MKKFGVVVVTEDYYEVYAENIEDAKESAKEHQGKLIETETAFVKEAFEIK